MSITIGKRFPGMRRNVERYMRTQPSTAVSVVYLILAMATPNNKALFILATAYVIAVSVIERSVGKALVYTAIILAKTNVGQTYVMPIIPPKFGYTEEYANGRSLLFVFSPLITVYLTLLISQVKTAVTVGYRNIPSYIPMTLLYMAIALLSSSLSIFLPELSMLFSLKLLGYAVWCISVMQVVSRDTGKTLQTMVRLLAVATVFELFVCVGQISSSGTLGLTIENAVSLDVVASDDFAFLIRPVGLHSNPNQLANTYIELMYVGLFFFFSNGIPGAIRKIKVPALTVIGCSAIIIVLSRCRSAYLAILLTIPFLLFISGIRSQLFNLYRQYRSVIRSWNLLIGGIAISFVIIIALRMFFSLNTFEEFGDYYLREKLTSEAIVMIQRFLPWGVGTGMYIPAAQELFGNTQNYFFPEAVHNGFLLILAENGPLALLFFALSYLLYIRWMFQISWTGTQRAVGIAGLVGSGIMMIFQPFINILPYITVFSYLYAKSHGLRPSSDNRK